MDYPLFLLVIAGTIGAVDVLYYHLWRFRLFAHPDAVLEETTHVVRHVVFLTLLVALSSGYGPAWLVLGLFAVDLVNSGADVLLERRSRARLGGLPSLESLVHSVSTFVIGLALGAYLFLPEGTAFFTSRDLLVLQARGMIAFGTLLLAVEAALFVAALRARRAEVIAVGRPVPLDAPPGFR